MTNLVRDRFILAEYRFYVTLANFHTSMPLLKIIFIPCFVLGVLVARHISLWMKWFAYDAARTATTSQRLVLKCATGLISRLNAIRNDTEYRIRIGFDPQLVTFVIWSH